MLQAKGINLNLSESGPVQAWKDLDAGKIDAAAGGLSWDDWVALMDKEGYETKNKASFSGRIIGMESIKMLTNKDIPVSKLNNEQVVGIFTGKVKNWSEVGGPDKKITVVLGTKMTGTLSHFQKMVLHQKEFTTETLQVGTAEEVKQKIIATPGAVGLGAAAQVDASVNSISYAGGLRIITLVTRDRDSPVIQELVHFIQREGQQYIAK